MSGGLAANADYVSAHADATGCPVLVPEGEEPVLRGVATAAAVAAGTFKDLTEGAAAMAGPARTVRPDPAARALPRPTGNSRSSPPCRRISTMHAA
ncbi:FGGY-family carbohydrate kinase [Roseivivax marinus]|uniref:FGGY-family carbohydrate kinase n=1 Tax=Roseivivax marinus TaxID=1379903 RepID=UPI002407E321|nr:FGGY-family carbohydrate kinase [Roseivivax marinus]